MKIVTRALAAVVGALALLLGVFVGPAQAARPSTDVVVFTLSPSTELAQASRAAASGWDKGTVVGLQLGDCAGVGCVHLVVDPASCGSAGCSTGQTDGSCLVQVTPAVIAYGGKATQSTVAHEVGHCMRMVHNTWNPRSVMYPYLDPNNPNWIVAEDRQNLNAIWSTTAAKLAKPSAFRVATNLARAADVPFTYTTDRASAHNAGVAAHDWSTGTVADIKKVSSCTGSRCIDVVTIAGFTLCGTDRVACAWWQGDGSCLVQVRSLAPPAYALALIKHEEGHCLGLPHSDDPNSIMYPGVGPGSDITAADRAWLNSILVSP